MIVDKSDGKLEKVKETAREMGPDAEKSLQACLDRLDNYKVGGKHETVCEVYSDFSTNSLLFDLMVKDGGDTVFNGGIIYSGPGLPSNGGAPSFTVSLDDDAAYGRKHMWSIHT